jgi:iron complex outermembrane receptor protein
MTQKSVLRCACALALLPVCATAQEISLPQITVNAPDSSLTAPGTEAARTAIEQTPGAVEVVPDTAVKNGVARTVKDIADYTPGVWAQPKWGDEVRLSIRGSGLSRNFHLRSAQLFMDGIPINTSDGYGDFQEIDPTAYRYTEIYKGANALRYGANALGGAINFVTPSGRDANVFDARIDGGGFGLLRQQASSGKAVGPFDYFITGSNWTNDGYRDHSDGDGQRASGNFGYRITPDIETRFYFNVNRIRQRIPGEVTKDSALSSSRTAAAANVANDWQRNLDTGRVASKTTIHLDDATVDFGIFGVDRHLMHPIFEWLDYQYRDYGAFGRYVSDKSIADHRNRFVAGFYILNGNIDARQYVNVGGNKGAPTKQLLQKPENYTAYAENSFYILPGVALVTGAQYLYAVREQEVPFTTEGDLAGRATYSIFSPKIGLLWDVAPDAQIYANISRSGEAPSFGEGAGASATPFYDIKAQTATTYEVGTRGHRPNYMWDLAAYRAEIKNELLCYFSAFGNCNVTNAGRTVHQGVEVGFGVSLLKNMFAFGAEPDRLWLNVAYTYSDFRFDDDATFGNNRLPGAPEHYLRAELLYKHPSGFSMGPNVEWVPKAYYVDSANTLDTEPYALLGFKAAFDNGGRVSGYIEGRNLLNKHYISATSVIDVATPASALFNPGDGRAVYAGLRVKL